MKIEATSTWYDAKELKRGHLDDAGIDIPVLITDQVVQVVPPHETCVVRTGLHVNIPKGFMGQLIARTSTAKRGIHIASSPIDAGYTGEIHVIITNLTNEPIGIKTGDKLAQLVVTPIVYVTLTDSAESARKDGAFGSTNK